MRRHLWWILGLALLGGGVALMILTRPGPATFGWTSYEPLAGGPDWVMSWGGFAGGWFVSSWQLVGAGTAASGLAVLAAGVGFMLGRRRPRRTLPPMGG